MHVCRCVSVFMCTMCVHVGVIKHTCVYVTEKLLAEASAPRCSCTEENVSWSPAASTVEDALYSPCCLPLEYCRLGDKRPVGARAEGKQSALSMDMALRRPEETRWGWHKR